MTTYIIARTWRRRPTLQHVLSDNGVTTQCGLDITLWSVARQSAPIPQILCMKCHRGI